jgi:hypothetical protein
MSTAGPSKTISDGLVFYYDTNNVKSYIGEPTTNIIPSPSTNAIPTYGNSWGTYNTNQYGTGTYASIGTVSAVTNNVVTMSAAHSLRTYDVMAAQTTGGGVSAGVSYFIKKLSSTTFCLYPYNSSQDGSQGYISLSTGTHKVYDSIALDQKVSINASSFPTMWYGPPHLPNSGLVKEIIPNGFDAIYGKVTDCIRLHYIRDDSVADGMSYGVDCTVTPSVSYTVSFWSKSVDVNAVGKQIQYQNYNYTGGSAAGFYGYFTLGPVGVWQKQSFTFTYTYGTIISYWFSPGGTYKWDLANIQVEQKDHATQFVAGTRSVSQGLLDLVGGSTIDLTNASFNGNSNILFASNKVVAATMTNLRPTSQITQECWFSTTSNIAQVFIGAQYGSSSDNSYAIWMNAANTLAAGVNIGGSFNYSTQAYTITTNQYYHFVHTYNGSTQAMYMNGVLVKSFATSGTITYDATNNTLLAIGNDWNSGYNGGANIGVIGYLPVVRIYNRALSAAEILKNYNSTKSRFGL